MKRLTIQILCKVSLIICIHYCLSCLSWYRIRSMGMWQYRLSYSHSWIYFTGSSISRKCYTSVDDPGFSEVILSLFIILGIPLNVILRSISLVLFIGSYYLAKTFKFDIHYSILSAVRICTLSTVVRWLNA